MISLILIPLVIVSGAIAGGVNRVLSKAAYRVNITGSINNMDDDNGFRRNPYSLKVGLGCPATYCELYDPRIVPP